MNNMNFICPTCKRPTQLDNEMIEYLVKEKDKYRDMLGERTKELERTRKALDVAKDTIRHADWFFDGDYIVYAKDMHNEIKYAIKAITALEQKD